MSKTGAEFFETHLDNQYACVQNWKLEFPAKKRRFVSGQKIDTEDVRSWVNVTNMRNVQVGATVEIDQ